MSIDRYGKIVFGDLVGGWEMWGLFRKVNWVEKLDGFMGLGVVKSLC